MSLLMLRELDCHWLSRWQYYCLECRFRAYQSQAIASILGQSLLSSSPSPFLSASSSVAPFVERSQTSPKSCFLGCPCPSARCGKGIFVWYIGLLFFTDSCSLVPLLRELLSSLVFPCTDV